LEDNAGQESIKLDLGGGRTTSYSLGTAGGQEILVIIISVNPKSADDKNYYEMKLDTVELKASKGPKAGRVVGMYAYRTEGQDAFTRFTPNKDQRVLVKGPMEIEFAYILPRDRREMELTVKGFKDMELFSE
jgi:hypothetical protein